MSKNIEDVSDIIWKNRKYLDDKRKEYEQNPFIKEKHIDLAIFIKVVQLLNKHIQNTPEEKRKGLIVEFQESLNDILKGYDDDGYAMECHRELLVDAYDYDEEDLV